MAGQESTSSAALPAQLPRVAQPLPRDTTSTTKPDEPAKLPSYFTQSQLALALTIQKSKPEGISTSDYCQRLRKRIKTGRAIFKDENHRYVDTSEFWKDQYTKIHLEKKALEDKVQRLEEERRLHEENSQEPGPLDDRVRQILRIPDTNHQMINVNLRKRQAQSHEDDCSDEEVEIDLRSAIEDSHLRLSSYVMRIGRYCRNLDNITKGPDNSNQIDDLVKNCNQILSLLDTALSDCCLPLSLLKSDSEDTQSLKLFQLVMKQVVLSYVSCFEALNVLCRTIPGRKKKSDIVYHMVMLFSRALNCIHTVSILQAEHEMTRDSGRLHQKRRRIEEGEYAINMYLARALAWITQNLEWKVGQPGHGELLEGILFSVLDHTGRLLSNSVFQEHVANVETAGNISSRMPASVTKTTKLESRYIIQVLHSTIGGSNRKELVAQVLMANNLRKVNIHKSLENPAGSAALGGDLLSKAKFLIQSTLVKSTVGGLGLDSLKLPTPPEEPLSHLIAASDLELYGPDWLIESVWALIGWDLVA